MIISMHDIGYLKPCVSPGAKLEVTFLIIERKPCDVNLAGGLEDARRDVEHRTIVGNYNVGLERSIKPLISTGTKKYSRHSCTGPLLPPHTRAFRQGSKVSVDEDGNYLQLWI